MLVFWRQLEELHAKAETGVSFPFFACVAYILGVDPVLIVHGREKERVA